MANPAEIAVLGAEIRHIQTSVEHPCPARYASFRPYRWQSRSLDEVRTSVGLRPMTAAWQSASPHDRPDGRASDETRAKISQAMKESWARRKALNPQIVTIKDRQVEIVPLPEPAPLHEYPPTTVDEWEQQMDTAEAAFKEKYGIEYTSSGLPIGVTVIRPKQE